MRSEKAHRLTLLYKNAVAVVDLVLDDLRRPTGKIPLRGSAWCGPATAL